MDKDEILARSRKENRDIDFVEMEVMNKANSIALGAGLMVCGILSILHVIFLDTVDYGIWAVYFSALSASMIVKFVKLRKKHALVIGLFYAVCFVMFVFFYLRDVLGAF